MQAGRALLDAIVGLRVPRPTLIGRNPYAGGSPHYNHHSTAGDARAPRRPPPRACHLPIAQ